MDAKRKVKDDLKQFIAKYGHVIIGGVRLLYEIAMDLLNGPRP